MRKLLSAVLALLIVVSMMGTAVFATEGESNAAGYAGTYEGTCTYQPNGMPMAIEYSFAMTLNADETYTFVSTYAVSGNTYDGLNENGIYTIDGTALTVTAADGSVWSGTISDGVINMNCPVSTAMSGSGYGSSFDVTMTLGGTTG